MRTLKQLVLLVLTMLAGMSVASTSAGAAPLELEIRQGRVIKLDRPASAVFVADPETADVQAHSPSLIYVFGRRTGTTSLYAVGENDEVLLRTEIRVIHPLTELQAAVARVAPRASIDVASINGGIVLSGETDQAVDVTTLEEVATGYLGENEKIINQVEVSQSTQVNLRVRIAEISRDVSRIFGINWEGGIEFGSTLIGGAFGRDFLASGGLPFQRALDTSGPVGALAGSFRSGDVAIDGIIDLLEREGLISVLAEPNLTALSGETASFLAGGEFPIPVGQDENQIDIEFKQFGVSLEFTPTVFRHDRISLKVRPEVSDLSTSGSVRLGDLTIPALTTRRAETTIELASGQSFAIGGLISSSTSSSIEKLPGLGDVPILGALFRSKQFRHEETELVIIVTPYLVESGGTRTAIDQDYARFETELNRPTPAHHTANPRLRALQAQGTPGFQLQTHAN